jgi:hypothetical protein
MKPPAISSMASSAKSRGRRSGFCGSIFSRAQASRQARRMPSLVIRMTVESVYLHCAKALMRSHLWDANQHPDRAELPSMGEMLRDQIQAFQGEEIEVETQAQMVARYQQSL